MYSGYYPLGPFPVEIRSFHLRQGAGCELYYFVIQDCENVECNAATLPNFNNKPKQANCGNMQRWGPDRLRSHHW